jgi:hypothetical protein
MADDICINEKETIAREPVRTHLDGKHSKKQKIEQRPDKG